MSGRKPNKGVPPPVKKARAEKARAEKARAAAAQAGSQANMTAQDAAANVPYSEAENQAFDELVADILEHPENILKAERDGKVKKVSATAGDSLAVDAVILEFA